MLNSVMAKETRRDWDGTVARGSVGYAAVSELGFRAGIRRVWRAAGGGGGDEEEEERGYVSDRLRFES